MSCALVPVDLERERRLWDLARTQFGVLTRGQALSLGYTPRMIQHRTECGAWGVLHPAVYAVAGTPISWKRDQMAACLWAEGVSAGLAAGYLYELPGCDHPPVEIVTKRRFRQMPRCGITVHTTTRLPRDHVTITKGIPCTTIERTLLDLCGSLRERQAAIAIDNALFRGLTSIGNCDHCLYLAARRGRPGCAVLRRKIKARWELDEFPNSPLETVAFEFFAGSSLPMPELQCEIHDSDGSFVARPDFLYRDARLVIEAHSRFWHSGVEARKSDLVRHERLTVAGYRAIYLTWADLTRDADSTERLIERARAERLELVTSGRA